MNAEDKWIKRWRDDDIFKAEPDPEKKKFFLTVAYPYPSGSMHVGHGRTYTVPDVIARFKRMQGFNVLFPMAWHVTGSPVLGIAERIKVGDPKTLRIYGDLYRVPEGELESFKEPLNIVKYFSKEYRENMVRLGYSIDWSRQFLTVTPQYSRFITWQFHSLRDKNLVGKGEHPVRYCPRCDNPVGDHDLMEGESASINEFVVVKFRVDDLILPAATLRPETVFGVTNMWLNPKITYLKVLVDGEEWLLSREASDKMRECGRDVKKLGEVSGEELIGRDCVNPVNNESVPILAASFVDPDYATGVVMSVPAHAPYDYVALRDLKSDIKPKTIIDLDGVDAPAKAVVEELGIRSQKDNKLEEATEVVYRREHSRGRMSSFIEGYGGLPVDEARVKISSDLAVSGDGGLFYEFSESPVVCRCGSKCVIKLIKDQWFLEYSSPEWKDKTLNCLSNLSVVPSETRQNFEYFIGWLKNWACTRRVGLGTRLPWDDKWIIEPLSDSTIYMAYYTIAHHLEGIDASKISREFFDYVFLGSGDAVEVAESAEISSEVLEKIRAEFLYWYPLDWRLSAKDLVGNHLTFHMFHHTALFPDELWPQGIVVFGMGLLEGEKMSSSKGNIILLEDAIEKYGSDVVRLFLMGCAEPWQDFDWRSELVENTGRKLKQYSELIRYSIDLDNSIGERDIDRWLLSRLHESVRETTEALDSFQIRKALQHAFFEFIRHVNWYLRRCEPRAETLKEVADTWIRLMAPFTPFTCEELWESAGNKELVSLSPYPVPSPDEVDDSVLVGEELVKALMDDVRRILEVTGSKPGKIHVYLAPDWKRLLYGELSSGKSMGELMKNPELRVHGKEVASIVKNTRVDEIPDLVFSQKQEFESFTGAKSFLEEVFGCSFVLYRSPDYDPKNKAKASRPMRPGIYVE